MVSGRLDGKVAVVTGAGGGIGLACLRAFHAAGACVLGADIDTAGLAGIDGEKVREARVDLRRPEDADTMVQAALDAFGRLDILVNNASIAPVRQGFLATTDEDWQRTLELNLLGYIRAARAAVPALQRTGGGVLIHVASEAARMPNPRLPDYSVSKSGVLMLSKVLAAEYTSQGIRSNVVSPAFIRSPIYDRPGGLADSLAEEFGVDKETALQKYVELNRIPVGRLGTVDEVASMVTYLATDDAAFISGSNFSIDGGVTPVI
ncbi:SDR family NAD(P)-dependent oxidoreductase [Mycolicibacterium mageritense]|uniref:SDR family NAD(P)-dependent oxidoreductase n=1 Tax=Mycolicibacterium mageritense TaxID=53462 RepID=UPI0023F3ECB8|nr:SDR family oxidoreductase [Mycolicibacterium mageritense]